MIDVIGRLKPEFVYSGFAMATPLIYGSRTETAVWERALTPAFYGLDIDDPSIMERHGDGIRTPTWGFFLEDSWRSRLQLSREQVRDFLSHPQINVFDVESGMWIELGPEPDLYPVEGGVPPLLELANRLLRPIRNDHMSLVGFGEWADDPNARFNREDSIRWLGRFDSDSDWPSSEVRHATSKEPSEVHASGHAGALRAKAGESCIREGRWEAMDSSKDIRFFRVGDIFTNLGSPYGLTVWRFIE